MQELLGLLFIAAIAAGLWLAARNLRAATRNPATRDRAQGFTVGVLLGWLLGR